MIDLWFLDESGFAPTLPTGYGWGRRGTRLVVPYEAPQGRRVNVVGALAPYGAAGPRLAFETRRKAEGRYDAAAHLAFVRRVADLPAGAATGAGRRRPCVVVLDNYSVHHAAAVKDAVPDLEAAGVRFCYLPLPAATCRPTARNSTQSNSSGARPSTRNFPSAAIRPTPPSKPPSKRP